MLTLRSWGLYILDKFKNEMDHLDRTSNTDIPQRYDVNKPNESFQCRTTTFKNNLAKYI